MNRSIHICVDIQTMLECKNLDGMVTDTKTGRELSDWEARKTLAEHLEKGWKVLPMGDCDNFDYQTGCKGHKEKEPTPATTEISSNK